MNKREVVLSLLNPDTPTPYIPAAFFLHFDPRDHRGQAAVDKHLEFFNYTGMDLVKIQYENTFPHRPDITTPADWEKMPCYGEDFYKDQWRIAEKLVAEAKKDALVIMTLYSPFMCAEQSISKELLAQHLLEDRDKTKKGLETITESLMIFAKGCIERGIDGFYHSTQGGETHRFEGSPIFDEYIKPYDLALMNEINTRCDFNILHVCDYRGEYADFIPFLEYPGHLVSTPLKWGEKNLKLKEVAKIFKRPVMGGLDRHGIITKGSKDEIVTAVNAVCDDAPEKFMLGADCTLPSDIDWENLKIAIDAAHNYER
jgi:uroporphyrinogen decarboxylase